MGLYEKIKLSDYKELLDDNDEAFMGFCPECKRETTFKRSKWYEQKRRIINLSQVAYAPGEILKTEDEKSSDAINTMFSYNDSTGKVLEDGSLFIQEYVCGLDSRHRKYDIYYKCDKDIIKIGQYPSEVDNVGNEYLDKVKRICDKAEAKEIVNYIKTALIMESYGYGIASLLYMRRAFEHLIAISEGKDKNDNTGVNMRERIKNNQYLPEIIKGNARVYNVISEGIHNQTEEECMELFKILKAGVIILITKTYAYIEEKKQLEELSKNISK